MLTKVAPNWKCLHPLLFTMLSSGRVFLIGKRILISIVMNVHGNGNVSIFYPRINHGKPLEASHGALHVSIQWVRFHGGVSAEKASNDQWIASCSFQSILKKLRNWRSQSPRFICLSFIPRVLYLSCTIKLGISILCSRYPVLSFWKDQRRVEKTLLFQWEPLRSSTKNGWKSHRMIGINYIAVMTGTLEDLLHMLSYIYIYTH